MVDMKICNALTDTKSTLKCFLCGATSKQFNLIDEIVKREVKTDNLSFGISVLRTFFRMSPPFVLQITTHEMAS